MSEPPDAYYTDARWQNWLDRVREQDLDPEEEADARLLLHLQDDTAIAVATVLTDYEAGPLDEAAARSELDTMRDIVLAEVAFDDEATAMLVDGVQTALLCVFAAAEAYIAEGPPADGSVQEYIRAAADAEAADDLDAALGYTTQAGRLVIDGADLDRSVTEDLEYGLVSEWVNGLDSLQTALADPAVIEDPDEDETTAEDTETNE